MKRAFISKIVSTVFATLLLTSGITWAYMPEPQSGGTYFQGKGTKASDQYEPTAGAPVYNYGKGLQWGPLHLKPDFDYQVDWDNNVFYEPHDPKDDVTQHLRTDTKLELPFGGGRHLLTGAYVTNTEWFDRFSKLNHTDQSVRGNLDLNFVSFTLNVQDTFQRTVDRSNTEFTNRVSRDENGFDSLLEIPFSSFFLESEILNYNINYKLTEDQTFDHNLFTVYQRLGYDWAPSTQILAKYGYTNISYTDTFDRNGNANQFMLGMRGNFTERISYQGWGGAQYRIYDDGSRPDFHDFVFRAALQYQMSEVSTLTLKGERAPEESTFDNQSYYVRNRAQLTWTRQIAERIYFNTNGILDYNEYSRITTLSGQDKTRRDYVWEAGAGLEYKMPNDLISFYLQYKTASRDSNITGLNYDDQTVTAGVKSSF